MRYHYEEQESCWLLMPRPPGEGLMGLVTLAFLMGVLLVVTQG